MVARAAGAAQTSPRTAASRVARRGWRWRIDGPPCGTRHVSARSIPRRAGAPPVARPACRGYPLGRSLPCRWSIHVEVSMFRRIVILCALGALLPLAAQAQGPYTNSWGFRAGFSTSPDQLLIGGQLSVGEVAPNLTFDPNID